MRTNTFLKVLIALVVILILSVLVSRCLANDPTVPAVATSTTGPQVTGTTVKPTWTPTTAQPTTTTRAKARVKKKAPPTSAKPFTG